MTQGGVALLISFVMAIILGIMLWRHDHWGNYDGYKKQGKVKKNKNNKTRIKK